MSEFYEELVCLEVERDRFKEENKKLKAENERLHAILLIDREGQAKQMKAINNAFGMLQSALRGEGE